MRPLQHDEIRPVAARERGAAMVEFIVAAIFLLVPMYLAVQALGKFADVQHTANSAARYAAWEKTVWFEDRSSRFFDHNAPNQKSAGEIRNETMVRILNDRRSGLAYADSDKAATTLARGTDPLWRDAAGVAFLGDPARMTVMSRWDAPTRDLLGAAAGIINSLPLPAAVTGTVVPPVPTNTLASATVRFERIGADSGSYQRLWSRAQGLPADWVGLDFEGRSAILSNSWAANATAGTTGMVGDSVPTASGLGTALGLATTAAIAPWDPGPLAHTRWGLIAPNVVPDDRLR